MFSLKIATECHSVRSLRSPVALSRQVSDVAIRRFTTLPPFWKDRTSGSRPRLPTRMTLFTDPAMSLSLCFLTDLPAVSPGMVNKAYTDAPGSLQLGLHLSGPRRVTRSQPR